MNNVIDKKRITRLFGLLSHEARLGILDELRRDEACVCHLQAVLGRPQAYISQQLRVLRDAGVIEGNQDGLNVYYRIIEPQVEILLGTTLGKAVERSVPDNCPCPRCERKRGKPVGDCGQV